MRKIIIFTLIFVLNLSLVNADILPIYPNINKLNVTDYPEWTFFQKIPEVYFFNLDIIPDNGIFETTGCPTEIRAIKDISKLNDLIEFTGVSYYDYLLLER
jgi:hypothetical protein